MVAFSSAAVTSSCDDISLRSLSTSAELDALLKGTNPGSVAAQHLISLSAKLDRFKQTVEELRESLTNASAMSPGLRTALAISVQPCANGAAVVDKQLHRLGPGNVTGLNPKAVIRYEEYHTANTRLFTHFIQVLQIATVVEQEPRLSASDGRRLLENAVEASQIVLTHGDILDISAENAEAARNGAAVGQGLLPSAPAEELLTDHNPGKSDKGKGKVPGQFFSSLSNSFKAMTASLRSKPEPMVIAMCQAARDGDAGHLKGFVSHGVSIDGENDEGYTPLICAIRANQLQAVDFLVAAGASLSAKDSASGKRKPPLFHAAECGFVPIAEFLINHGADMREQSWSGQPFFIEVAKSDRLDIIRLFLAHGCEASMRDSSSRPIFVHAVRNGSLPHMKLLQEYGADVNAGNYTDPPSLHIALNKNRPDIVSWLLDHGADPNVLDLMGNTAMISAFHKKNYDLVKILLNRGANPNAADWTGKGLLWLMLQSKDMEDGLKADLIRALLDRGADPNQSDCWGESIMALAVTLGNTELLHTFLVHGGNPNKMIKDDTFLLYAIDQTRYDHVRMLLKHGADVNAADKKGRTPLVEALQMGNPGLIELLLQSGADVNQAGQIKPLALARILGNRELVQAMTARGAQAPERPAVATTVAAPTTPAPPTSVPTIAVARNRQNESREDVPPPYTEAKV